MVAGLSERIDARAEALHAKFDEDQVSVPSDITCWRYAPNLIWYSIFSMPTPDALS